MKIISATKILLRTKRIVLAIGVFDGLHYAHSNILRKAVSLAKKIEGKSVVLTFFPHPQKEETIYSLKHRLNLLQGLGIDICIVVKFDENFAKIKADNFIKDILIKRIHPDYIFVGSNFRFGQGAEGNVGLLKKISAEHNVKLRVFDVIRIMDKPVSSTYIRSLIKRGNLNVAQRLLGRRVSVLGTVIKGNSIARELGFPTANIDPHHEIVPPSGVYLVRIVMKKNTFSGICYIGSRPTFKNKKIENNIEVYIFNFNADIYEKDLEIQFIRKIRNEQKFKSPVFLVAQIKKDLVKAKKMFSLHRK
jgi:riboflavin kinase/FMN adenylyltransferase